MILFKFNPRMLQNILKFLDRAYIMGSEMKEYVEILDTFKQPISIDTSKLPLQNIQKQKTDMNQTQDIL